MTAWLSDDPNHLLLRVESPDRGGKHQSGYDVVPKPAAPLPVHSSASDRYYISASRNTTFLPDCLFLSSAGAGIRSLDHVQKKYNILQRFGKKSLFLIQAWSAEHIISHNAPGRGICATEGNRSTMYTIVFSFILYPGSIIASVWPLTV